MTYKKFLLAAVLVFTMVLSAHAQRTMDKLDRGLVAVQTSGGVFCTWRIFGEEYYDVTYNIYRNGTKLNSEPLTVSNYTDNGGSASSTYQVEAVVRGTAQAKCDPVKPWSQEYLEITPNHGSLTSTYVPNDVCCADVDGDGEIEILMKFDNQSWANKSYQKSGYNGEYFIMEVYKLDGRKLWWIDWGPNMADFQNNEQNIIAYDWDGDGKAEAVLRASDGTKIHTSTGQVITIGDASKNYLGGTNEGQWFVHQGDEYLLYLNGETGEVIDQIEYPLKRLEPGETDLATAWGDGYGHRSTKHFFGAPYLDGRTPSIFIARGIYTRHKMVALNVSGGRLTESWRWECNEAGSPWYGQGYHNFGIADVDWDGRDEIVFGSMVIDDNGSGLSTTGLGHGDAQHCGDFNPYVHGQEIFACNEDNPANNYRDATTSKIYYRKAGGGDDGRSNCGNFSNNYPGCLGSSGHDLPVSTVYNEHVGIGSNISVNFRIYWNGDLCEELFDGNISSFDTGRSWNLPGGLTNNSTKATPCYQGDILGDWREEVIMRTSDNKFRIYTTTEETPWRNYTLWHDTQYRNAMVWQMCGYNQPPHVSYFLGELEGITMAPPPLTMTGRKEVIGSIGSSENDQQIILCETGNTTVSVDNGASPYIFFDNAPTWVQGHDDNDYITTDTYTHTLTGGAFTGGMRLVKQGDGVLVLPTVTETYTGNTDVWAGTLQFDGVMASSPVWLNRHTNLISNGGQFNGGIKADYNATIYPGGKDNAGTLTTSTMALGFGARVVLDVFSEGQQADCIKATSMSLEKKNWQYGPEYSAPVFQFVTHSASGSSKLAEGNYLIGEIGSIEGSLDDLVTEGLDGLDAKLSYSDGKLYLSVGSLREATTLTWNGNEGSVWDLNYTKNFKNTSNAASEFVSGDAIVFDDNASTTSVNVIEDVFPSSVVFNNSSKDYTLSGKSISGSATLTMNGSGNVTLNNVNKYTGKTQLNNGKLTVTSLANTDGTDYGSIGGVDNTIVMNGGALSVKGTLTGAQPITLNSMGGTIDVPSGSKLTLTGSVKQSGTSSLYKTGAGTLTMGIGNNFSTLYVNEGTVTFNESSSSVMSTPNNIVFDGNNVTVKDIDDIFSYSTNNASYEVTEGSTGILYLDGRCNYTGRLTGKGTLTVYATNVRNVLQGNWSAFEGTLVANHSGSTYDFTWGNGNGLPKAILNIASGTTFNGGTRNISVGNLAGAGNLSMVGTLTVGSRNEDVNYKGTFSSGVKIVKVGIGSWTFKTSYANVTDYTFKGGDVILDGTNTTADPQIGTGIIIVQDEAALKGMGKIANARFYTGGVLEPGSVTSSRRYGPIASTGFIQLNSGSKLNLIAYANSNTNTSRSYLVVGDKLTLNGELNVELGSSYKPAEGDEIILWTAGSFEGNPSAINLPALPDGLYWDKTELLSATGKLKVTKDASLGISTTGATEAVSCRVYTVGGQLVAEYDSTMGEAADALRRYPLRGGSYIIKIQAGKNIITKKVMLK